MRRKYIIALSLLILLGVACNSGPVKVPATLSRPASPPFTPTSQSVGTSTMPATLVLVSRPTNAVMSSPLVTPLSPKLDLPPGLIYKAQNGVWRVEANGNLSKLLDQPYDVALSSDGTQLLAVQNEFDTQEVWLIDPVTRQRLNLIENVRREVCCPQWWSSRPQWVLFQSTGPDEVAPDAGYLSAARVDGQGVRVLDVQNRSVSLPAPAPDGRTIAYDGRGQAWLYDWDNGPQQFDPQAYGLKGIQRIASPAWSPDGKQLAWYISGDFGQGGQVGLAVFDLEANTGWLLHLYTTPGRGGWFAAPVWSPDGQWIAFSAEDQNQARAGLWIARVNGQEERLIKAEVGHDYALPVWSPDGQWLAADRALYNVNTGQTQLLDLPADSEIIDWINPSSQ